MSARMRFRFNAAILLAPIAPFPHIFMIKFLANVRNHLLIFGLLLAFNVLLLLGRFYVTRSVIGGDAVYYYSTIRSLVIDRNLDFKNEYQHFHNETSGFTQNRKIPEVPSASPITKKLPNRYPIGSAIALIPFFALGHLVSTVLNSLGLPFVTDGYGTIYQLFTGIGSLLYGFFGLVVIYFLGRKLYDSYSFDRQSTHAATALAGTIGIWLATPLIYYMTMEPLMSHTTSVFFVAAFVYVWYVTRLDRSFLQSIALGILGGLICITRYQDGLFLFIPIIDAVVERLDRRILARRRSHPLLSLAIVLVAAALVISSQLYVNRILFGSFWTTGYAYVNQTFTDWENPKLLFTLFSTRGGLLLWSPILIFAIVGLILFVRKQVLPGMLLLLVLLGEWYLISAWSFPHGGDSFGNRLLLSCAVIFAVGLMQFLHLFEARRSVYRLILSLGFMLILANGILAGLYCLRIIGNSY